ncbi:MAG TPA: ABC transporter ATP-binding protein [Alphaproteobacteria bacterium]|nr:ABC transporter ATP-binding protein [Alphaproteobacteria bacterium]
MTDALLQIENAVVRHGPVTAVDNVSIELRAGELVALIGPNGAGKSSLLNAIAGTIPLAKGGIRFSGRSVAGLRAWQRARLGIGLCPEGRRVFAGLSVRENLVAGTSGAAIALEPRIAEIFSLFPALAEHATRPAWQLSGGQQQMLAVGRALMRDPRLLLLDEPTLGLAPAVIEEVLAAARRAASGPRAVLLADQSAATASLKADRIYILRGGRIIASGAGGTLPDAALGQVLFAG